MHPSVALMLRNPMLRQAIERALASRGRGGDTMIAHLNPAEALMLRRLGGSGTINPRTGLREFTADPRGDIGGGNNHDNQPGSDHGMGGGVGNGNGGGGGYGHAGDGHGGGGDGGGSGAGAGGGHSGGGHTVDNPNQPTIIQQPTVQQQPQPVTLPPAPVPVTTAPLMSTTATTNLIGSRFGALPSWATTPYKIGDAPTSYPTPGLTTPGQPPTTGGGGQPPTTIGEGSRRPRAAGAASILAVVAATVAWVVLVAIPITPSAATGRVRAIRGIKAAEAIRLAAALAGAIPAVVVSSAVTAPAPAILGIMAAGAR